ncbi:MAG TPA: hypothetical protein VMF32_26395 [Xanthobacteraceae bacterium]|nr:hypothetical protein [Xanthobacteraceae bacterium]
MESLEQQTARHANDYDRAQEGLGDIATAQPLALATAPPLENTLLDERIKDELCVLKARQKHFNPFRWHKHPILAIVIDGEPVLENAPREPLTADDFELLENTAAGFPVSVRIAVIAVTHDTPRNVRDAEIAWRRISPHLRRRSVDSD